MQNELMGKWARSGLIALGETLCCACTVLNHFQTVSYSVSPETLCLRVLRTETLRGRTQIRSGEVSSPQLHRGCQNFQLLAERERADSGPGLSEL